MKIVPWKQQSNDPFKEFFDTGDRFFGLTLFPSLCRNQSVFGENWSPAIDIDEDSQAITIKADLPGMTQKDISVNIENNVLTIKGERKSESEKKDKNYHRVERAYGYFERSLELGSQIDSSKAKASYKNGVLELILPKKEQAKPRQVQIDVE